MDFFGLQVTDNLSVFAKNYEKWFISHFERLMVDIFQSLSTFAALKKSIIEVVKFCLHNFVWDTNCGSKIIYLHHIFSWLKKFYVFFHHWTLYVRNSAEKYTDNGSFDKFTLTTQMEAAKLIYAHCRPIKILIYDELFMVFWWNHRKNKHTIWLEIVSANATCKCHL